MKTAEKVLFLKKLEAVFQNSIKSSVIHECSLHVEDGSSDFIWSKGHGGRTI
ncbi:MAG: hypothetical protein K0R31_1430 [Clostridiales bacterium]|nr:hypothetical protein [Clostridiales bacterium]